VPSVDVWLAAYEVRAKLSLAQRRFRHPNAPIRWSRLYTNGEFIRDQDLPPPHTVTVKGLLAQHWYLIFPVLSLLFILFYFLSFVCSLNSWGFATNQRFSSSVSEEYLRSSKGRQIRWSSKCSADAVDLVWPHNWAIVFEVLLWCSMIWGVWSLYLFWAVDNRPIVMVSSAIETR
jgi:hypothetical protein